MSNSPSVPLAGDWPTFGNGPAHSGYFPGTLGNHTFTNRWSATLSGMFRQVAVAQNKVYATTYLGQSNLTALYEASGKVAWQVTFPQADSINPPTYDSGAIFVQRQNNATDSQLWSIDAATGAVNWNAPYLTQWDVYLAPCVANGSVWMGGGRYGGLYGFNQSNGSQLFFTKLAQYSQWTPTYSNGRLLTWVAGSFQEQNPLTGAIIWSKNLGWNWAGYEMNCTIAASKDRAYFIGSQTLYCMDLTSRQLAWQKAGFSSGTPAVAKDIVYAVSNDTVVALGSTGSALGSYAADSTLSSQPIVTDDALIVSSDSHTYVFNLTDYRLLQRLPAGGSLSLANGVLYMAASTGELFAYSCANDVRLLIEGNPGRFGQPSPYVYGPCFFTYGSTITNKVTPLIQTNMGKFQCVGWTGTGSVPASGTDTVVVVTLQTNSTLTWNWAPVEFQLMCHAAGPGSVDASNGWYAANSTTTITAIPRNGYRFIRWIGDVPNDLASNPTISITMNQGRTVFAEFGVIDAGPHTGNWPTFGNGPAHSGYVPGMLGNDSFSNRWTISFQEPLQQVSVANGDVYITPLQYMGDAWLAAVDSASGQLAWQYAFSNCYSINPPTCDAGSVFVQRVYSSDSQLWSFEASSGTVQWQAPFSALAERCMAPTVADGKVWIDSGSGGGLYGFKQNNGTQITSSSLDQCYAWTPAYANGRLFSWVAGNFREHDPLSGAVLWSTNLGWSETDYRMDRTIAIDKNCAYFHGNANLYAINLSNNALAWKVGGQFTGTPAVANDIIYAISNNTVLAYASDGTPVGRYAADTPLLNQPIVTDDSLIVASISKTFVFSLFDYTLKQTLNLGGFLSLSDNALYVATSSGQLCSFSTGGDIHVDIRGNPAAYGRPSPQPYGTSFFAYSCTITNKVAPLIQTNMGRFQCVGWTGTGSVPASGTDSVVVVTLQTNSTLTWNWAPVEFQLMCHAAGPGSVDARNGWYAANSTTTITATPRNGYRFIKWIGDVPNDLVSNPVLSITMNQGRTFFAEFGVVGAGPLTGNWPTFGNGPAHSGYFPGMLSSDSLTNRWTISFQEPLQQVSVANGDVFITPLQNTSDAWLAAVDSASGQLAWQYAFSNCYAVNPPTCDSGSVFVERVSSSDSQLWSFEASSGTVQWQAPFSALAERCMAPTVADGKVWVDSGYGGGLYGFKQTNGTQFTSSSLDQYFDWTPAYANGRLFSWVAGDFREHDPLSGAVLWSTNLGWSETGYTMDRTIAIDKNCAYFCGNANLYAINLSNNTLAWKVYGQFTGTPAVANDIIYAISNNTVLSYASDGTPIGRYVADGPLLKQPIVTDDSLIVASDSETFVFSLFDYTLKQTLNVGGFLSLSDNALYVATSSGQLCAFSSGRDIHLDIRGNPAAYGRPSPQPYGTNFFAYSCTITNKVTPLIETNMGRFQCVGWTGTGSAPASGTDSVVVVTLQTNSTLTWNWAPVEFQLMCHTAGPGSVDARNGWYPANSTITITVTPRDGCRFIKWIGDVPDDLASKPTLSITMNQGRTVVAEFGVIGPDQLTGNWPTFGNGPAHTGYFPGVLGNDIFTNRWTISFQEPLQQIVQQVSVANGYVYLTHYQISGKAWLTAVDSASGQLAWQHAFSNSYSITPPTCDSGSVFVQRGNASDSQLWSFEASSGTVQWQAPFSAQWDNFMAPTVTDGKVWVDGGTYGGIYGFDQNNGTRLFFCSLDQYDSWTPAYANGRLFSWVAGNFREHNPLTGTVLWTTNPGWGGVGYSMNRTIAINEDCAYFYGDPTLYAINLSSNALAWQVAGQFTGTPAVANGIIYAISNNTVLSYASDGTPVGRYVADAPLLVQPIVTDDSLFVASDSKTFVFSLFDYTLRQTLNVGGFLSLSDDVLYVATSPPQLCAFSREKVVVHLPPSIQTQPANQTVLLGNAAAFNVAASGTQPLAYRWSFNGTNISGATLRSYSIPRCAPTNVGSYSVIITNDYGSVTSAVVSLTVLVPPAFAQQPFSQTVGLGTNATFSASATGDAPLHYQWRLNGQTIPGAVSSTYLIPGVRTADAGNYTLVVSNNCGAITSSVAVLTALTAPAIAAQPADQTVISGSPVTFSVNATGSAPLSYQWLSNSIAIPYANASAYTISAVSRSASYNVIITNAAGVAASRVASLTVFSPPSWISMPQSQSVGAGSNATFQATATGDAPLSYQWLFNGNKISTDPTLKLPGITSANAGRYSIIITNNSGAITSSVTLIVLLPPAIAAQPQNCTNLAGTTASFNVAATGSAPLAYQWFRNGSPISGAVSPTYSLVTSASDTATFSVVVTNAAGAITSAPAALIVPAVPAISVQPTNQTIWIGSNATFSVSATGFTPLSYQWQFNSANLSGATSASYTCIASNSGYLRVIVTNIAGCVTSRNARLTVAMPPVITTQPQNRTNIAGSTADFTVLVQGTAPLTFQWQHNGTNVDGATAATLSLPPVSSQQSGAYSVIVTNNYGAITSAVAMLTVVTPPTIAFQPLSQMIGVGTNAAFAVQAFGDATLVYQWQFNGINLSGATGTNCLIRGATPQNAGAYTVVITNNCGAVTSSVAILSVCIPPSIIAQPRSRTNSLGTDAQFSVAAAGSEPLTYQWQLSRSNVVGATLTNLIIPAVSATNSGAYTVVITNLAGSITSSVATLTVLFAPVITTQPSNQTIPVGGKAVLSVSVAGTTPLSYQWFKAGVKLAGSSRLSGIDSNTLTIQNVTAADAAAYYITITNSLGKTASSNAVLAVYVPDTAKPTLVITSPTAKQSVSSNLNAFTASGTARDNVAVSNVLCQLNTNPWFPAVTSNKWTNWTAALPLQPGTNILRALATDTSGNSLTTSVQIIYIQLAKLAVLTNAGGTVSLTNGQWLVVGSNYTATALPATGWLFSNWSGTVSGNSNRLVFTMRTNTTLQPIFTHNPFQDIAGEYRGLFIDQSNSNAIPGAGYFSATLTPSGTFSAAFSITNKNWPFSSQFSPNAVYSNTLAFGKTSASVVLQLELPGGTKLNGYIRNNNSTSQILAWRAGWPSNAPQSGCYTVVIPGSDAAAIKPGGDGYAYLTVNPTGNTILTGMLSDGAEAAFSQNSLVCRNAQLPVYIPLYSGAGALFGWLTFTNEPDNDLNGLLTWIRPASAKPPFYTAGFTNTTEAAGSRYTNTTPILKLSTSKLSLKLGNLPAPITNQITLAQNNTISSTNKSLSLTFASAYGQFTGSLPNPFKPSSKITFKGVVLQKQTNAFGYFLGTNQSGEVRLFP